MEVKNNFPKKAPPLSPQRPYDKAPNLAKPPKKGSDRLGAAKDFEPKFVSSVIKKDEKFKYEGVE